MSLTGILYGPYDDFGNLHNKLDNYNGKKDQNDNYGYYSTPTFPYQVGCFEPGIIATEPPECTTNNYLVSVLNSPEYSLQISIAIVAKYSLEE